ncbi:hypothetical protein G7B40_009905 [Aetokthonos hydrillicola Thurmond2011]|jgi:hypothetical protein|uniref:Uncharacterized protein n=1 Tax=Aetokthonos hydrillicola Thurmond2011 TaxID=2712845 RepID=A0AAP5I4G4_9CYAN|nr:hypothetical protein [Aetokthonos hydrillicola]MBO3464069.1 hypothetical protein [Aetokthonos hydrillicola CCALA 1050]MBW4590070.1 hypothetical protein [Aetokthonos hydrillicola CCALA 1050]MDR9894877.1 hypothetical protein [Aetokthonos hydrillicola Thurmond2011]
MKKIIAGALIALPLMTTFATKASASEVIIRSGIRPTEHRGEFIARGRHRVFIPGHWQYRNHHRQWIRGHYEWRY